MEYDAGHTEKQQTNWRVMMKVGVKGLVDKLLDQGTIFIPSNRDNPYGTRTRSEGICERSSPTEYADIWEAGMVSEKQYYACYERLCYGDYANDSQDYYE